MKVLWLQQNMYWVPIIILCTKLNTYIIWLWQLILWVPFSGLWAAQSRYVVKNSCGVVCESTLKLPFESMDWVKQLALPSVSGPCPIHWSLNRTKSWVRKNSFFLCDCLWAETSVSSFRLGLELTPQALLLLRTLNLNRSYTIDSPGSPAYRSWDFSDSLFVWTNSL